MAILKKIFLTAKIILMAGIFFSLIFYKPEPEKTMAASQPCPTDTATIQVQSGFLTVANPNNGKFQQTTAPIYCIISNAANIPTSNLNYDSLKSTFYTQYKGPIQKVPLTGSKTQVSGTNPVDLSTESKIYNITGDFYINSNITIGKTGVIFVDGNLTINILQLTHTSNNAGLVFVVGGGVNIDQPVTRVDAIIISQGQFCDSWSGLGCYESNQALVINGSVISLDPLKIPTFKRTNGRNDSTHPGETINFQPKYLVILKDIFSRNLTIWNEIY